MRIVHVAPDYIPVPPQGYGGIERVVFDCVEKMNQWGHDVFLYAMPGSRTGATVIPYQHQNDAWKIAEFVRETLPSGVDVIHDHTHGSVIGRSGLSLPVVCSIHVPWWNRVEHPVFLSEAMRSSIGCGQGYVVHPGINLNTYPFSDQKSDYLLFLGRLIFEKGIVRAIEIAQRAHRRLVIAGPAVDVVEPEKYEYFTQEVAPRLRSSGDIVYLGEVSDYEKVELLRRAQGVLFTSETEAFGLVMIEALACGTPVLALANGAVPEVLGPFPDLFSDNVDDLVQKAMDANYPPAHLLREYVEQHFSHERMASDYLKVYEQVITRGGISS